MGAREGIQGLASCLLEEGSSHGICPECIILSSEGEENGGRILDEGERAPLR